MVVWRRPARRAVWSLLLLTPALAMAPHELASSSVPALGAVLEKDAAQTLLDNGGISKKAFDSRLDPDSEDFEGEELGAHSQEMTGIPEEDENENPNDSE